MWSGCLLFFFHWVDRQDAALCLPKSKDVTAFNCCPISHMIALALGLENQDRGTKIERWVERLKLRVKERIWISPKNKFEIVCSWGWNLKGIFEIWEGSSPALHLDVGDGVEVSGQVILIHHGGSSGWLQQPNPQICDSEEVSQVLGGIQLAVQRGHVV